MSLLFAKIAGYFGETFSKFGTRDRRLDLLKGLAVMAVIALHVRVGRMEVQRAFGYTFWIGMAVPVFMLVSAYLFTLSYIRKGWNSAADALAFENLMPAMTRFLMPFLLLFPLEVWMTLRERGQDGWWYLIERFPLGGFGSGSYYVTLLVEFLLFFPLLSFAVRRSPYRALICAFVVNVLVEVMSYGLHMSNLSYGYVIFRYWFLLAIGAFFAVRCEDGLSRSEWIALIIAGILGGVYKWLSAYDGFSLPFFKLWTIVNLPSCLWILPFMALWLFHVRYDGRWSVILRPIELIGVASYDVYLVQKIYHGYFYSPVAGMTYYGLLKRELPLLCIIGFAYFLIESTLTRRAGAAVAKLAAGSRLSPEQKAR